MPFQTQKQILTTCLFGSVFFSYKGLSQEPSPLDQVPTIIVEPETQEDRFRSPTLNSDNSSGFSQKVDVKKSEEINPSIPRVLRSRVPVTLQETLGAGASRNAFLGNGFSGKQLQIYFDEIPVANGFGAGGWSLVSQTTGLIGTVELRRGVRQLKSIGHGSSRMGAGLYLTSLGFHSLRGEDMPSQVHLKAGQYGLRAIGLRTSGQLSHSSASDYLIAVNHNETNGNYEIDNLPLDNNASKTTLGFLKAKSENHQVAVQLGTRRTEIIGSIYNRFKSVFETQNAARVDWRSDFLKKQLNAHVYWSGEDYAFYDRMREIVTTDRDIEEQNFDEIGLQLSGNPKVKGPLSFSLQSGVSRKTLRYKNLQHREDALSTALGVTHFAMKDQIETELVVAGETQPQGKNLSSSAGVESSYSPEFSQIKMTVGVLAGYRLPSLKEKFGESELVVGNVDLNAEKNLLQYASADFSGNKFIVSGSVFQNKIANMIEYEAISSMRYKPFNFTKVQARGVEVRILFEPTDTVAASMFGVVQSVKNNASESEYYKNDIPAHPREFGGGSLNWMLSSKFEASFEHEFQKSRPVNRANTQKLNDSHNSNAGLTFKEKSGAVKLQLVNIFDRENVDLRGNPRPPRMYEVGAELSF